MADITLVDVNGSIRKVRLAKELASGGAGAVYSVLGDSSIVVKLYNAETLRTEGGVYADKITRMLQYVPSLSSSASGIVQLAWPLAIARDGSGSFVGFTMPALDFQHTEGLESLLIPKQAKLKNLRSDLGARITVAANLAGVVRAIHDKGHQIVDMKPPNLRFYKKELYVAVLDCDGFQVQLPGRALSAPQVTIDYLAPEYQSKPIVNHEYQDRFALAVIIFRLLNYGIHPYTGIAKDPNAPTDMEGKISRGMYAYAMTPHRMISPVPASAHDCFPDDLRQMFDRAFGSFVEKRPTSGEWADSLKDYALKSNMLLDGCVSAGHLWFSFEMCGECQRNRVLKGVAPAAPQIVTPVPPVILPPVTPPAVSPTASGLGNPATGTQWMPKKWMNRIALGAFLLFCISAASHFVSYYTLAAISIGLAWGAVKLNTKTLGSTFGDAAVMAVFVFMLAGGGKFGWHKVFEEKYSQATPSIVIANYGQCEKNTECGEDQSCIDGRCAVFSAVREKESVRKMEALRIVEDQRKVSDKNVKIEQQPVSVKVGDGRIGATFFKVSQPRAASLGLNKLAGALVDWVEKNSPAERAGIKSGDVILRFNDHEIVSDIDLRPLIANAEYGSTAILELWHEGKIKTLSVQIGKKTSAYSSQNGHNFSKSQDASAPPEHVRSVLALYPLEKITEPLDSLLAASKFGRDDAIAPALGAIQRLSRPERGDRKSARAANGLGLAAMVKGEYNDAVTSFAIGVKADPADQEIVDNLASALLKNGQWAESLNATEATLMLNPMRSSAWVNLATIFARSGNEDVAISSLKLAYRFSRNKEITRGYLEKVKQEDDSFFVREAASKTLAAISVPIEGQCKQNTECPGNESCMDGRCALLSAVSEMDSARKRALRENMARETTSAENGAKCSANSDCISNLICWRSNCVDR
jgi:hypothetical protein